MKVNMTLLDKYKVYVSLGKTPSCQIFEVVDTSD